MLAKEKEKEFMVLQKETEVRLTQKYMTGWRRSENDWRKSYMMVGAIICLLWR